MPPAPKRIKTYDNNTWKNPRDAQFSAPDPFFRELILGASGSGKSTYLNWIVSKEHDAYDQIVLIGPYVMHPQYGLTGIVNGTGKVTKVFLNFGPKSQKIFYDFLDKSAKGGLKTLVVVDDPIGMTHFVQNVNRESAWNALMAGVKQKNVGIKFSCQGDKGLSPIGRAQCDRIVRFPDYANIAKMHDWCAFMDTAKQLERLLKQYAKRFHAIVFCKFAGERALFLIDSSMNISPIRDFHL